MAGMVAADYRPQCIAQVGCRVALALARGDGIAKHLPAGILHPVRRFNRAARFHMAGAGQAGGFQLFGYTLRGLGLFAGVAGCARGGAGGQQLAGVVGVGPGLHQAGVGALARVARLDGFCVLSPGIRLRALEQLPSAEGPIVQLLHKLL